MYQLNGEDWHLRRTKTQDERVDRRAEKMPLDALSKWFEPIRIRSVWADPLRADSISCIPRNSTGEVKKNESNVERETPSYRKHRDTA